MAEKLIEFGELVMFRKSRFDPVKECEHLHVLISKTLLNITCKDCKKELNPVVWAHSHLDRMARWHERINNKIAELKAIEDRLEKKGTYACKKCGEMNTVDLRNIVSTRAVNAHIKVIEAEDNAFFGIEVDDTGSDV